VKLVTLSASSV